MSFEWPAALLALLIVPALGYAYWLAQNRRRRFPLTYSSITLVRNAAAPAWRRHVPPALYLFALTAMVVGLARPQATVPDLEATGTVILVIDSSRSMLETDVRPSRIDAAKAAVRQFIEEQPKGISIGVVAFAGGAELIAPPTTDRRQVVASVNSLQLGRGTNIGDGLLVALDTILFPEYAAEGLVPDQALRQERTAQADVATAIVVLLSDGASTVGPPPLLIARDLSEAGVKTYTVGLGAGQGGMPFGDRFRRFDEAVLRDIAEETGGEYYAAEDAPELEEVYQRIARENDLVQKRTEVTFLAVAAGLALMLGGGILGAMWSNRLP
jgi:Ca-activated chloride channel family protein